MVPFHMIGMVSYKYAVHVVTLSVRHTVFEIFDHFKNAVTLKTGIWVCEGH